MFDGDASRSDKYFDMIAVWFNEIPAAPCVGGFGLLTCAKNNVFAVQSKH